MNQPSPIEFLPLLLHLSANNTTPFFSLSKAFVNSETPTTGESIGVNIRRDTTVYGVHTLQSLSYALSFARMERVQKHLWRQIWSYGRQCPSISQRYF